MEQVVKKPIVQLPFEVRIAVESMRAQIVHAFSGLETDLQERVAGVIDEQIKGFSFEAEIMRLIEVELKRQIESTLRDVIWQALRHADVETAVRATVKTALRSAADPG